MLSLKRNTPTGVGKTARSRQSRRHPGKHPHGRGEDFAWASGSPSQIETPPRAWGRHGFISCNHAFSRNTPTGVGKTPSCARSCPGTWKHPHGRGEDMAESAVNAIPGETPPRAWGRLWKMRSRYASSRNTPTGVGKTELDGVRLLVIGKHPHGRGEDFHVWAMSFPARETPPRAWGRPAPPSPSGWRRGNTPTGVGKTRMPRITPSMPWKHPHGRGEDYEMESAELGRAETPPRAWGRRFPGPAVSNSWRNTPTGVGKTRPAPRRWGRNWKHPHGRGEDEVARLRVENQQETPPRAWGRLMALSRRLRCGRNTPTGVGKTKLFDAGVCPEKKHPHGRGEDCAA